MQTKFVFITGGVLSGLGKGIITCSIGKLLQLHGYSVTAVKIDPYINIDAGTMRPTEHGEVWVTEDGGEIDQDLGNYERFLGVYLSKKHNITTGKVFLNVIEKERSGKYLGKTVQPIPHITDEIKKQILDVAKEQLTDFVLIEIGGIVGDYENILFLEAARQMHREYPVFFAHVSYLPTPNHLGEMKTKPTQSSVRELGRIGIRPDIIIGRASKNIDKIRKEKLALFCDVSFDRVICAPDVENIYEVPLILNKQKVGEIVLSHFGLKVSSSYLRMWEDFINHTKKLKKKVKIGIIGKYFDSGDFSLVDSYISVIEAVKHACWANNAQPKINWVDSKVFEEDASKIKELDKLDCIIVPGGFGKSGIEGKISAIKYCRENNIPYLGLCLGLQLAVVEYARNVCGLKDAHSIEIKPDTKYPVVDLIETQKKLIANSRYGGTMRLGAWKANLKQDTKTWHLYNRKESISERHRHRLEVNPKFIEALEKKSMVFSGCSEDKILMEFLELPDHPFFIATQSHPEFKSQPMKPAPLFNGLIRAALENS